MTENGASYCNPLNLSYKFQNFKGSKFMGREAADPSVVFFLDRFWLFASMSDGFWHSKDLKSWAFQQGLPVPATDYAPDIRVINNALYLCASKRSSNCPIFRTENPLLGQWEPVSEPFPFWDPNLFQDDDGRVYFYWGCSPGKPIYGVEMDPATLEPISDRTELIFGQQQTHGWERRGENYKEGKAKGIADYLFSLFIRGRPFIEGAWMTRFNGRYYLQYSAPGTEFNTYADGVYLGDSPLGPFTYAEHNPFSLKPGGYISGAGHGSTFQGY